MAKYSQNQSCGHTCPWGAGDDNLPPDAFTLAAIKAGHRVDKVDKVTPVPKVEEVRGLPETPMESFRSQKTSHSTTSQGVQKSVENKMLELLEKCLDKKVLELREKEVTPVKKPVKPVEVELKSSRSTCSSVLSQRSESSRVAGVDRSARDCGYEALDRYPALLQQVNGLTDKAITQGLTSTGKQKQAMKLSDASLGKFDADQSRIAYLQMQKSAADARNKNRSALTFGDETSAFPPKTAAVQESKEVTMAGKRAQAQKLSDASLGKFDVDQSQVAFREMHNTAAQMRNKHRVGQGIF